MINNVLNTLLFNLCSLQENRINISLSLEQTKYVMNFSPCLDIFFENLPFAERIKSIANLGYKNFEFWTWWDKNMDEVAEVSQKFNVHPVAYCTKFISLVDQTKRSEYIDGLAGTIENVKKPEQKLLYRKLVMRCPAHLERLRFKVLLKG